MKLPTLVLATACLLGGCATYGDIRAKAPAKTLTVKGDPGAVADCTLDKLQLKYATGQVMGETFQKTLVGQTVHIAAQLHGWTGPQTYEYDLAFAPAGAGMTTVEARAISDLWGRPRVPPDVL